MGNDSFNVYNLFWQFLKLPNKIFNNYFVFKFNQNKLLYFNKKFYNSESYLEVLTLISYVEYDVTYNLKIILLFFWKKRSIVLWIWNFIKINEVPTDNNERRNFHMLRLYMPVSNYFDHIECLIMITLTDFILSGVHWILAIVFFSK